MDKVALVTGAGRGIGLATARRFLGDGWRVALLDIDAALLDGAMAALAAAFAATTCWMWRTAGSWSDAASVSERLSAPVAALVVLAVGITVTPSVTALIG